MENLEIRGFRGFKHLTIERLSRVNLIAGKNNVGKSSLLEALQLLGTHGSPNVIRSLLGSRDQLPPASRFRRKDESELAPDWLFQMLYLHHNPTPTPDPIAIGPLCSPESGLSIRLEWFNSSRGEYGRPEWHPVRLSLDETPWSSRPGWIIETKGRRRESVFLDSLAESPTTTRERLNRRWPIEFVPSCGFEQVYLGRLFDQAAVSDRVSDVLEALRLIAPDVDEMLLIGEGYSRKVLLRVRHVMDLVPLKSRGEGVNRVVGIILALVNSHGSILLVNEIESGIHHSIMAQVWNLIFRVAEQLNIQVFATTHSWDCIEGFQKAAADDQDRSGLLIRLDRRRGDVQATYFDQDELTTATRERIEVR